MKTCSEASFSANGSRFPDTSGSVPFLIRNDSFREPRRH
jgi:hypothetical protein